jgi:hypothetical protein
MATWLRHNPKNYYYYTTKQQKTYTAKGKGMGSWHTLRRQQNAPIAMRCHQYHPVIDDSCAFANAGNRQRATVNWLAAGPKTF